MGEMFARYNRTTMAFWRKKWAITGCTNPTDKDRGSQFSDPEADKLHEEIQPSAGRKAMSWRWFNKRSKNIIWGGKGVQYFNYILF